MNSIVIKIPTHIPQEQQTVVSEAAERFSRRITTYPGVSQSRDGEAYVISWTDKVNKTIVEAETKMKAMFLQELSAVADLNIVVEINRHIETR